MSSTVRSGSPSDQRFIRHGHPAHAHYPEPVQQIPDTMTLARFTLARQHPITVDWVAESVRLAELARDHEDDVMLATDLGVATVRRDRFAPGRPVEVMLNRWLAATAGLEVMLSMRYEGGDVRLPFVDASVLSRSVTPEDLGPLAEAALACFGELRPGYLRVWSAAAPDHFPGAGSDKRFLAAPLRDLRAGPVPERLRLGRATDLDHYAEARAAYAAVDADHPDHRRQASLQDREDLAEVLEAGLLFDVLADDHWSGYVAATATSKLGLPGFTVHELILTESARGAGFGRSLTTLLARALPGNDSQVLTGTIHLDNTGARRAALAAGRLDVGGWFQVPLSDPSR